jgi:hypothetical protein
MQQKEAAMSGAPVESGMPSVEVHDTSQTVSIIFDAPCLFIHYLLCVLFTLRGVFMHFSELTY